VDKYVADSGRRQTSDMTTKDGDQAQLLLAVEPEG